MKRSEEIRKNDVPAEKSLALAGKSGSKNAHCISGHGAYQATLQLSPSGIEKVFGHTNPRELLEIADMLKEQVRNRDPMEDEGPIKDLAFKRQVLIKLAEQNSEREIVTQNEDGRYKATDGQ